LAYFNISGIFISISSSRRRQVNILETAVKKSNGADRITEQREALRLRQIWFEGSDAATENTDNLKRLLRRKNTLTNIYVLHIITHRQISM